MFESGECRVNIHLHLDPHAPISEQTGDDRVPGLVVSDLAAKFAGEIRALANSGIEGLEITINPASSTPGADVAIRTLFEIAHVHHVESGATTG
jgi:hypothetical protein